MKKILSVAIAATLLAASCSKTDIINPVGNQMGFSGEMGKLTKADDDLTLTTLQGQNFKVWSFYAYADAINNIGVGDVYDGIAGIDVKYQDGKWVTTNDYYWPGAKKALDFFAVSSKSVKVGDVEFTNQGKADAKRTMKVKDFVVTPATPAAGVGETATAEIVPDDDLMVAEFVRQSQEDNDKQVKLRFKHALSKVKFNFITNAPDTDPVTVTKLVVNGLTTKGTLIVTETDNAGLSGTETDATRKQVSLAWTDLSSTGNFIVEESVALTDEAKTYAEWLVIPQTIYSAGDAQANPESPAVNKTVEVSFTIGTKNFTRVFALCGEGEKNTVTEWDINQAVTYTINLSPNKITFDPSVEDWSTETTIGHQN